MLNKKHILISGSNGFIGQHLATALLKKNTCITQIVRLTTQVMHQDKKTLALDLGNYNQVIEIIKDIQPDYVIHLASSKDRNITPNQFRNIYGNNVTISLNLIDACLQLKEFKRFIFLGSCDEYGQIETPFHESQREMPTNAYGLSKLAITKILSSLHQTENFPSLVLRPTVIYGPNQGKEMFLPALIQSLLAQKDFPMTLGQQMRDFVYVDDVVDAIVKAIQADDQVNGQVINIGSGVSHQVKDIANLTAQLIHPNADKYLQFGALPYRPNEPMNYAVNIDRAKQLLDWQPQTSLQQGLQQTIAQFKQQLIS